jgi:hypothetical protein
MSTTREQALELALQILMEEIPNGPGWPAFDVALRNAKDLLDHRISPDHYLNVMRSYVLPRRGQR